MNAGQNAGVLAQLKLKGHQGSWANLSNLFRTNDDQYEGHNRSGLDQSGEVYSASTYDKLETGPSKWNAQSSDCNLEQISVFAGLYCLSTQFTPAHDCLCDEQTCTPGKISKDQQKTADGPALLRSMNS